MDRINKTPARQNCDREIIEFPATGTMKYLLMFGTKAVHYIVAGFVAHKLIKKVKCDTCVSALLSQYGDDQSSLISQKDKGKLV